MCCNGIHWGTENEHGANLLTLNHGGGNTYWVGGHMKNLWELLLNFAVNLKWF